MAYEELVGGVLNMRTEHFQRVNGYSNLYWGWGAEDDDMAYRFSIFFLSYIDFYGHLLADCTILYSTVWLAARPVENTSLLS